MVTSSFYHLLHRVPDSVPMNKAIAVVGGRCQKTIAVMNYATTSATPM